MKNIIVPIDFSEASFNAISYGAFLANAFSARITLVHAYTDTSVFDETNGVKVYDSEKELEAANAKFLKKEVERIGRKFTVKTNSVVMKGKPVRAINEVVQKVRPDLIVMGMKGKGESNSIFGSNTVSMIDETTTPLLIVPQTALYQTIDSITLASDFKNEKLLTHFSILGKLITKFDPFVQVLNVHQNNSKLTLEMVAKKMKKKVALDQYHHSVNVVEKDDVERGIFEFLRIHPTDMLVMVARKRGLINKMFEPSHTKKMTYETKIPLLVLHENTE